MHDAASLDGEVAELCATLIRNACVNDGTDDSGGEDRSARTLADHLEGAGLDLERHESRPGRGSVVARIEGSDPAAAGLMLMGHIDVVPVDAERWSRDPFGGEVVDGELWGRGAVDMLDLTSAMAVAFKRLAGSGWRPRGTLTFLGVADEEALGTWGADWLLTHRPEAVSTDYVLTEPGGPRITDGEATFLPVATSEKGSWWVELRVAGTPGHGSQPWKTDNALVNAAEVVRRIAAIRPQAQVTDAWLRLLEALPWDPEVKAALADPATVAEGLERLPLGDARRAHACTHTTFSPNVAHGGVKTNVIPGEVVLEVDVRTLPGQRGADVAAVLDEALGDLRDRVTVTVVDDDAATESPLDTPLWHALGKVTAGLVPGSSLVPAMCVGATDARFFRRAGVTAYGFGLLSDRVRQEEYDARFHGDDERVDLASLGLAATAYEAIARELLT